MHQPPAARLRILLTVSVIAALAVACGTGPGAERIDLDSGAGAGERPAPGPGAVTPDAPLPERVMISLPGGVACTLHQIELGTVNHSRRFRWSAVIESEPGSEALFAVYGDRLSGVLRMPGADPIRVESGEIPGTFRTEVFVDAHGHAPCVPLAPPATADDVLEEPSVTAASRGGERVFDLLVAYTADARSSEGGTEGIHAEIDLAVSTCNRAFTNSGIDARVNLVRTMLVDYEESGSSAADLRRLKETTDGIMDEVHQVRQDAAADLVALLVRDIENCGRAYIMQALSTSFRAQAFSVTDAQCAVGNQTFIHELGHNLGCAHNRENAQSSGVHNYSFGHREPVSDPQWRTIMSYAPGSRLSYFSTPLIEVDGAPIGVASGSRAADNARSIGTTALFVESFLDATTRQPYSFDLVSPEAGTVIQSITQVAWEEIGPVRSYTLLIDDDPAMGSPVPIFSNIDRNWTFLFPEFISGECGTLYWTIEAEFGPGLPPIRAKGIRSVRRAIISDINDDGAVDCADLGGLIGSFGSTSGFADLNGDGVVDSADLGIMISDFGTVCDG